MEGEEDAQPKTLFHPDPALHEEYSQRDKGNYMPLCVTSFDLLKQRLKSSNLAQNEVMTWFKTDDEGSGRLASAVHPSFSSFEHTNEQSEPIKEEYYNLFDGKSSPSIPIC